MGQQPGQQAKTETLRVLSGLVERTGPLAPATLLGTESFKGVDAYFMQHELLVAHHALGKVQSARCVVEMLLMWHKCGQNATARCNLYNSMT
jgi:hypothetical protein